MASASAAGGVRFGGFEFDLSSRELRKRGSKLRVMKWDDDGKKRRFAGSALERNLGTRSWGTFITVSEGSTPASSSSRASSSVWAS